MRIVLQKFFVVIGLNHQRLHLAQPFDDHLRRVTEIGNESERTRPGVECVTDRINRVMRHWKSLDRDIANRKIRASAKQPPVPVGRQSAAADCFCRERIAINRDMTFPAENFEARNVIAVLVGEKHAIELSWSDSALLEAQDELARA